MGSLLQCILRTCFDDEEQESRNESYEPPHPISVASHNMTRVPHPSSYQSGTNSIQNGEGETRGDDSCCHHDSSTSAAQQDDSQFVNFFRLLRERWRKYDFIETTESQDDAITVANSESSLLTTQDLIEPGRPFGMIRRSASGDGNKNNCANRPKVLPPSPLRTASSYDKSREVPSICSEEIVLPGSDLQKQMAQFMVEVLEAQGDECVICMEPFDPSNPRMPTLCGCGENKTYFHLPCLYQWIEQSRHCPSCRQPLRWEEF